MKSSSDYVCFSILFLSIAGVTGQITNSPMNAVAEVGGQATFSCTSIENVQHWFLSRTREEFKNQTYQIIAMKCVVQSEFTTHYEVDRPEGSQNICNLIVKAITMLQAGVYTCQDVAPGNSSVLTVIDRDASITVNSAEGIFAGDTVTMSYTVRYNTSTAAPQTPTIQIILIWTASDGNIVASSLSLEANSVTSSISVKAGLPNIPPYSCRIYYLTIWPSNLTRLAFANNIPDIVHDPLYSSTINVSWQVTGSTGPPDAAKQDSDDESTNGASGLSVGLFKRNNVIILMVGIAVLLLIGSKGTSGV